MSVMRFRNKRKKIETIIWLTSRSCLYIAVDYTDCTKSYTHLRNINNNSWASELLLVYYVSIPARCNRRPVQTLSVPACTLPIERHWLDHISGHHVIYTYTLDSMWVLEMSHDVIILLWMQKWETHLSSVNYAI